MEFNATLSIVESVKCVVDCELDVLNKACDRGGYSTAFQRKKEHDGKTQTKNPSSCRRAYN